KHLQNVCNYELGKKRKAAEVVHKGQEVSTPMGKAKVPGRLGSTVPPTRFFAPLQRSVLPELDIVAKKLNFIIEPGTLVGRVLNLEIYPTPSISQQAKIPANITHGSPTSTSTFQSVEVNPKLKGKQKASQTPQSTTFSLMLTMQISRKNLI
ncbi:hypothetical protein K7432_017379, partial [Basidiobolus ranarum]